ncbi:MAG TPA: hypothetical protein P5048_01065 [Chlamydiales bacterium]|nr:hypothetical protein [Chlamydiales bacterium]
MLDLIEKEKDLQKRFSKISALKESYDLIQLFDLEERISLFSLFCLNPSVQKKIPLEKEIYLKIAEQLIPVEKMLSSIGGIVGYFEKTCQLIDKNNQSIKELSEIQIPEILDLTQEKNYSEKMNLFIERLDEFVFIFPIGGAGDRLNLLDPKTQKPLPTAMLPFRGISLLEGMIDDLKAFEYLYFKTYNKQIL